MEATHSREINEESKLMCAALEKVWSVVNDMVSDMTNRGIILPSQVSVALRGAKVLINLCRYHPNVAHDVGPQSLDVVQGMCVSCCGADIVARIECELRSVEDMIVMKAFNTFGAEYAMQWQKRIAQCWKEIGKLQIQKEKPVTIPTPVQK